MASAINDVISNANLIGTQFDGMSIEPLRPEYIFDGVSQQKKWDLNANPNKGDTLVFVLLDQEAANTAPLSATNVDITSGADVLSYVRRNVTLELYGRHQNLDTLQFVPESFVSTVEDIAFTLEDQSMNSLNIVARDAMDKNRFQNEASGTINATFHFYGSDGTVGAIGPLKAIDIRKLAAKLKSANVKTFEDGFYLAVITPEVQTQLKAETGNAAWGAAVLAGDVSVQRRWSGDVGTFEGFRFVVNNECLGALSGTVTSYYIGREGVGKAIGKDLRVATKSTMSGPHDNILTMFWDVLVGYRVIRREAILTLESSGSTL